MRFYGGQAVYPLGDIGENSYIFIHQEFSALPLPSPQKPAPAQITTLTTCKILILSQEHSTHSLLLLGLIILSYHHITP